MNLKDFIDWKPDRPNVLKMDRWKVDRVTQVTQCLLELDPEVRKDRSVNMPGRT